MVSDESQLRRTQGRSSEHERRDRGQVILIGALALAFIVLGVVIVFNGVLYTDTLSSGQTGQSATVAEKTELEVEQGVACILNRTDTSGESEDGIEEFSELYQNAAIESGSGYVEITNDSVTADNATVTIVYDSHDLSYERQLEISAEDCPQ